MAFCPHPSGRHGTPGPGMIDTSSHYLVTALAESVQRSDTEKWLGTCAHTHTHTITLRRSSNTHQLHAPGGRCTGSGDCVSVSGCVCESGSVCGRSRGRIFLTLGKMSRRTQMFHTLCVRTAPETCYFRQPDAQLSLTHMPTHTHTLSRWTKYQFQRNLIYSSWKPFIYS